jgi:Protein of unknown function (DUF4058)
MPSPFPGMDLYLEYPVFWSSFHTRLMVAIADAIEPQLAARYYVEVESRTYQSDDGEDDMLIGIPDAIVFAEKSEAQCEERKGEAVSVATQLRPEKVSLPLPIEVQERYLEVRELGTDAVITVIELLSPTNKRSGEGRSAYEKKRRSILGSATHLVELDLLRGFKPMPLRGQHSVSDYRIVVSRSQQRPTADLYAATIRDSLPSLSIPLKSTDVEPIVVLQEVFNQVYERARYAQRIDYRQPLPPPKLSVENQQWVDDLLAPLRSS